MKFSEQRSTLRYLRHEVGVVGRSKDDRYDVERQSSEELLGDVISTETVLERQNELVLGVQHPVDGRRVGAVQRQTSAATVNVDVDELRQLPDVRLTTALSPTVGHDPGDQSRLSGGHLLQSLRLSDAAVAGRLPVLTTPVVIEVRYVGRQRVGRRQVVAEPLATQADELLTDSRSIDRRFAAPKHPLLTGKVVGRKEIVAQQVAIYKYHVTRIERVFRTSCFVGARTVESVGRRDDEELGRRRRTSGGPVQDVDDGRSQVIWRRPVAVGKVI